MRLLVKEMCEEISGVLNILSAVGGGADRVGDLDITFGWEWSGVACVDTLHCKGKAFQTVARGLAVSGGPCGAVQVLHSITTRHRRSSAAFEVAEAWSHRRGHLTARDRMCHMCTHHDHDHHRNHACNLQASHRHRSEEQMRRKVSQYMFGFGESLA